jgi:hypothetical protein
MGISGSEKQMTRSAFLDFGAAFTADGSSGDERNDKNKQWVNPLVHSPISASH